MSDNHCPTIEVLARAEEMPEIRAHLEGCAHCRAELALLREFERAEPRAEEVADVKWIQSELRRHGPAPARPRVWIFPWRIWSYMAVAALILIGVSIYVRNEGEPPLTPGVAPVWRSGEFAALSPVGDITGQPVAFRWESVNGAVTYGLTLQEVDGSEVWSAETSATEMAPPPRIATQLAPGRAFQWKVIARDAKGGTISSTALQSFHILMTMH